MKHEEYGFNERNTYYQAKGHCTLGMTIDRHPQLETPNQSKPKQTRRETNLCSGCHRPISFEADWDS